MLAAGRNLEFNSQYLCHRATVTERARRQLRRLLEAFLAAEISIAFFCSEFEREYNLELDSYLLSAVEAKAFKELFDRVVWYSPFDEERALIPNYVGEDEVRKAAEMAAAMLGETLYRL